jgi:hypothetical protein
MYLVADLEIILRVICKKAIHFGHNHDLIQQHLIGSIAGEKTIVMLLIEGYELRLSRYSFDETTGQRIRSNGSSARI